MITHKAACLLRARLEADERWRSYSTELGQSKFRLQQAELAGLVPPSQRSKVRSMNVGKLVDWGPRRWRCAMTQRGWSRESVSRENPSHSATSVS
jgi:hypothetical protein